MPSQNIPQYSWVYMDSADCYFASCVRRNQNRGGRRTDTEMWALQAWGELALGLAAPRAAHAAGNDYGNQALAWDVVRAVTDLGAVSALTRALARVDLDHSRAPACGAALVRPLEMLTRRVVAGHCEIRQYCTLLPCGRGMQGLPADMRVEHYAYALRCTHTFGELYCRRERSDVSLFVSSLASIAPVCTLLPSLILLPPSLFAFCLTGHPWRRTCAA